MTFLNVCNAPPPFAKHLYGLDPLDEDRTARTKRMAELRDKVDPA